MDIQIITTYVICDELLKTLGFTGDLQAEMNNAEVITFAILAAKIFHGNHQRTRWFCQQVGYFPKILSASRLNRRIHKIPWHIWQTIFRLLAAVFKNDNISGEYAVDSFPVPCCKKSRIDKRKIFLEKAYMGYAASLGNYFCGLKVHMVVTSKGEPIEMVFAPGSEADVTVLWRMDIEIPAHSTLYADGAYNCFDLEDLLRDANQITLMAKRGSANSTRGRTAEEEKRISSRRQIVETTFSVITGMLPKSIHARTEKGFLLKLMSAVLAYSISVLFQT